MPADAAEKFEAAMHDALPHLFEEDPQLLHRLVTMLSPAELMARGVPVHRWDPTAKSSHCKCNLLGPCVCVQQSREIDLYSFISNSKHQVESSHCKLQHSRFSNVKS